jgi:hypothetical protein
MLKVFYMKSQIFSGQVQLDEKRYKDFAWLDKSELQSYLSPADYAAIKDSLASQ